MPPRTPKRLSVAMYTSCGGRRASELLRSGSGRLLRVHLQQTQSSSSSSSSMEQATGSKAGYRWVVICLQRDQISASCCSACQMRQQSLANDSAAPSVQIDDARPANYRS